MRSNGNIGSQMRGTAFIVVSFILVFCVGAGLIYLIFHTKSGHEVTPQTDAYDTVQKPVGIVVATETRKAEAVTPENITDEYETEITKPSKEEAEYDVEKSNSESDIISEAGETVKIKKEDYKVITIGSSDAKMYIPDFLKKSTFNEDEKWNFGFGTVRLISKSGVYSGSPKEYLSKERLAGMSPVSESSGENWAFESGYLDDDIYWRKVKIIGETAYYAVFKVPASDKENAACYSRIANRIFKDRYFPLNK